jgi:hypothetical protein
MAEKPGTQTSDGGFWSWFSWEAWAKWWNS